MSRPLSPTLFDDSSPEDEDFLLLDDLTALVALGLRRGAPLARRTGLRPDRARAETHPSSCP